MQRRNKEATLSHCPLLSRSIWLPRAVSELTLQNKRSTCRGEWEKIGEVMGSAGASGGGDTMAVGNRLHAGQQWDFVFDVDIDPNQPPLKLACNRGDNPYDVADRWTPHPTPMPVLECQAW